MTQWIGSKLNGIEHIKHLPKKACFFALALFIALMSHENIKFLTKRVLKLQKRAARIILDADSQASSVKLFKQA